MSYAATQTVRQTKVQPAAAVVVPNYVQVAQKNEDTVLSNIESNPIYKFIIDGNDPKEMRIANAVAYLMNGVEDGTANAEELDRRRQVLTEFNAFIQVIRKQLGAQQAKEITNNAYADFQRIVNQTSEDVEQFQQELSPLGQLADLFTRYGADGNIIEKINTAKAQKVVRERNLARWTTDHADQVRMVERTVSNLITDITQDESALAGAWWGKAAIEARLTHSKTKLTAAQADLATVLAETPDGAIKAAEGDIEQVDEGVLQLQNIGGPAFKKAVADLRDHTELALAKISANFDEAIGGLTNTRGAFITMDRNCSDANYALTILENAVQNAEVQSRQIAANVVKQQSDPGVSADMAELERMDRERRSSVVLGYTASLTTFMKDIGIAVASLRSGQSVIQNILRMNALALESANTHKITGIANTADAVTIIIGSIIDVCNRAASRALADGLNSMRVMAQVGAERLANGTYEGLEQQNEQLEAFVESVQSLKTMTQDITANSVDLLRKQFEVVTQMRAESNALADASDQAQRSSFEARAGVTNKPGDSKAMPRQDSHKVVGLKVH